MSRRALEVDELVQALYRDGCWYEARITELGGAMGAFCGDTYNTDEQPSHPSTSVSPHTSASVHVQFLISDARVMLNPSSQVRRAEDRPEGYEVCVENEWLNYLTSTSIM